MKPKMTNDEQTNWAKNALGFIEQFANSGAKKEFIAGVILTSSGLANEIYLSGMTKEERLAFYRRVEQAIERALMLARAKKP